MTHLYFVRHAQPNYSNHDDRSRELSEKGLADRKLVTAFLAERAIDAVLSSPYKRAVDTVKGFADSRRVPVVPIEDFRERRVDSVWIADFNQFARQQWADFSYRLVDGESLEQVQERNVRALEHVLATYAGKSVAIGSHGTALCTIINHYCPAFGYDDFKRIQGIMPWIVHFAFEGGTCVLIQEHDVFTGGQRTVLKA